MKRHHRKTTRLTLAGSLVCLLLQQPALSQDQPGQLPAPGTTAVPKAPGDQATIDQILRDTMTSPSTLPAAEVPLPSGIDQMPALPPQIVDHNKNKTISLGPLHTGPLIQIATLRPVRLEATFNEPITLRDCLLYALHNSLPIRINRETYLSNIYNFCGAVGGFLPTNSMNLTYTHSHIFPETESNSRVFSNSLSLPFFQGGRITYSMLSQLHRTKAARNQYGASVNDTLLNTYNAYYNLLLQRALLQIRIKSVEVSEAQLRLNEQLYLAGTGTRFAVMQSRTQLALDRQSLLQQQVAVRLASLQLGYVINYPLAINIVPIEESVTEASLVDESMSINDLLNVSLTHRPELRQYEFLRLASARSIQVAAAPLYPTAGWTITYTHSSTSINGPNNSRSGGGGGSTTSTASSGGNIPAVNAFGGLFNTVSFAFNTNWTLSNLGASAVSNILSARAVARQSLLQANQVLQQVSQQVRSAYLNALTAREQIDVTATGVASSAEELRLANLRVQMGVGTNLELIQAQRDYITALINQAQAIIASNQAQAQLLHDTGLISVETLTSGYHRRVGSNPDQEPM